MPEGPANLQPQVQLQVDLVKAAEDLVAAAAAVVVGAERSCVIEIDNILPFPLVYQSEHHDHGGFSTLLPKAVIEPFGFDLFTSRSSGFATGTEAYVTYRFGDHKFTVHWSNPWIGGNSSDCSIEPNDPRSGSSG